MSRPPTALLFDLDGTLVDSLPDIAASANHVRVQFDLAPVDLATVRDWVGDGLIALLQRALSGYARAEERFDTALEVYREHHATQCTVLVEPFAGVRRWLATWQGAGHPMAVVTNKPEEFSHAILEHLDLGGFFAAVIGGDTTPTRKPDPAPVHEALRRLGAGDNAMMIGDSPGDVLAGQRAGIRTAAALYGYRPAADLRAVGPDECWSEFGVATTIDSA